MGNLYIYRGLPASGKTSQAKKLQRDARGRLVGRDHLRSILFGMENCDYSPDQEEQVTALQTRLIREGLRQGDPVIVDDMNLRPRYVRQLLEIAVEEGAPVTIIDLSNVSPEECVHRDSTREHSVGENFIADQYDRYILGNPYPLPVPELDLSSHHFGSKYTPPEVGRAAIIVDVDGTVALRNGRSPYDESRVLEDFPNLSVINAVSTMFWAGYDVVFLSGRSEDCRRDTEYWIRTQVGVPRFELFMRGSSDKRKDYIVKQELFDQHVRDYYRVVVVFDDRSQVVNMWRAMGLTCLQVAPGDF